MNILLKYCPTFTRLCVWLWHSPTFTTWGNYAVQSLRLVLVTPFILTRFDETEIAAWYLFASLNFFGMIVSQRLGLTFSRMFAFAMGGASNLAPIKGKRDQENGGKPNWAAFERAYGTIGSINLGIGWLNVVIAFGMGWFGLSNLLQGYEAKGVIWLAFALMQGTALITFIFQHFQVALQGMNYIALVNRWGIIFGVVSCLAGSLSLYLDGGLIALVVVMQCFSLAGIFRSWFLLRSVEAGRVSGFRSLSFDREMFFWAFGPAWKGFLAQLSTLGARDVVIIIFVSRLSVSSAAGFLFTFNIMKTLIQLSNAPINSHTPRLASLLAAGNTSEFLSTFARQRNLSLGAFAVGSLFLLLLGDEALMLAGASIRLWNPWALVLLLMLLFVERMQNFYLMLGAAGNDVICLKQQVFSGGIMVLCAFLYNSCEPMFVVFVLGMVRLLCLNLTPYWKVKGMYE